MSEMAYNRWCQLRADQQPVVSCLDDDDDASKVNYIYYFDLVLELEFIPLVRFMDNWITLNSQTNGKEKFIRYVEKVTQFIQV